MVYDMIYSRGISYALEKNVHSVHVGYSVL